MHGGLAMTLADEVGAWTLIGTMEKFGFTARFAARLKKPVRIGVRGHRKGSHSPTARADRYRPSRPRASGRDRDGGRARFRPPRCCRKPSVFSVRPSRTGGRDFADKVPAEGRHSREPPVMAALASVTPARLPSEAPRCLRRLQRRSPNTEHPTATVRPTVRCRARKLDPKRLAPYRGVREVSALERARFRDEFDCRGSLSRCRDRR